MTNLIANWWRSRQFRTALKQGNTRQAVQLLRSIQKSRAQLSWLEKLFRDKLKGDRELREQNRELSSLKAKLAELNYQTLFEEEENLNLQPDGKFVEHISNSLKFIEHDESLLQCTEIESCFQDFEAALANFLSNELNRLSRQRNDFTSLLEEAVADIRRLKQGEDPEYKFKLSPHIYLMRYFLENVYSSYIAWFLIYRSGLLPTQINILDIAAGPGTVVYGLALLLQSSSGFFPHASLPMHISYYSLELQRDLQYQGLQFWRKYMEPKDINAFFRYHTASLFDYYKYSRTMPQKFFDFITISHCFFYESETKNKSQQIYQDIFRNCLKPQGYVILTIQDKKLLRTYNVQSSKYRHQELNAVTRFVEELGLKLVWYKYLNSIGQRETLTSAEFGKFARENLPPQTEMSPLLREYLGFPFDSNYTLDDYVILAQRK